MRRLWIWGHYHHDQPETITESPELRGLQQPQSSEAEISKDISNDVALDSAKIPEASQEPEEETDESGNVAAAPPPPVAPVAPPRKQNLLDLMHMLHLQILVLQ